MEIYKNPDLKFKQPVYLLIFTIGISVFPFILHLSGIDFSSPRTPFLGQATAGMEPTEVIDGMFYTLAGAFTHTILEWSAFSAAFFTVILSFAHFAIKRDVTTPILGIALFSAGCMDAFHTLAADRLIPSVADNRNLIPFTWAICRMFNAIILIGGISLLLSGAYKKLRDSFMFVIAVSVSLGVLAYIIIHILATSSNLPNTMFADSIITRPWDVGPLLLYLFAGIFLLPKYFQRHKNFISYSILISVIPHIATQLHIAFGSSSLFDNHFNIGHFLKIFAYLIPFIGLTLEYIKTYREQKSSETRIRTILESTQEAIIVIDAEGFVTLFNPIAETMFNYSADEIIGRKINMLMPEPHYSGHDGYLYKYLQTGQKKIIGMIRELEGRRRDKTVFPMELGISEMQIEGKPYFVGSIRDVTERKASEETILAAKQQAEDAVREAENAKHQAINAMKEAEEANQAKSIFLANMSHEIRTPMNAILGYSQILLRRTDLDSGQRQGLQTIDNSGKNLLEMINEILDISKIEAGKMDLNPINFDMKEFIAGISDMFKLRCRQKRLNWKTEGLKKSCLVFGDELKLRGILINLIGNAVKFTESGEIEFKISVQDNQQFLFEILDTGRGIASNELQHIFNPFHQAELGSKLGGTGLGLAISSKQLQLMESELKVESQLGEGSRFYFTLHLPEATGDIDEGTEPIQNILYLAEGCHVKALVVDDIKENRDVLTAFLSGLKIDVKQAVDGRDGLEKIREYLPDIIFLDMRMPVMDGQEAIKEIHKEFGKDRFKIVIITASAFDYEREVFIGLGAQEFISKPFRVEQIAKCLDNLLDIEFEYSQEASLEQKLLNFVEPDYSKITLPEELYSGLKSAAETYSITHLQEVINKLQGQNYDCNQLAIKVKDLITRYDMDGILEIIEKLNHGK